MLAVVEAHAAGIAGGNYAVGPWSRPPTADSGSGEDEEEVHWVQCDDCDKWRIVEQPAEEDQRWTCKDNPDWRYNSCEIPQQQEESDTSGSEEDESSSEDDCVVMLEEPLNKKPRTSSKTKSELSEPRKRKPSDVADIFKLICSEVLDWQGDEAPKQSKKKKQKKTEPTAPTSFSAFLKQACHYLTGLDDTFSSLACG